jgi:uncharacterized LabA/DUF88 family protein
MSAWYLLSALTQPALIANELRRQADVFIDLRDLQSKIGRDPLTRSVAREHRSQAP